MSKHLVIIGASGHGKVIADIAVKNGYTEIVFLDDNTTIKTCGEYSVVGTSSDAMRYSHCDFVVGIGGGSSLDAAKALAQLTDWRKDDPERSAEDIFFGYGKPYDNYKNILYNKNNKRENRYQRLTRQE